MPQKRICKRKGKNTIFVIAFGRVQTVTELSMKGIAWIMGCLVVVEASYLLRIIMFFRITLRTGSNICLMTSGAKPVPVPKTDTLLRVNTI